MAAFSKKFYEALAKVIGQKLKKTQTTIILKTIQLWQQTN